MTTDPTLVRALAEAFYGGTYPDEIAHSLVDLALTILRAAGFEVVPGWQPIETAPKDGTEIMMCGRLNHGRMEIGKWDDDRYATKPKPHWKSFLASLIYGERWIKKNHPTHWRPLPDAPLAAAGGGGE